ncbi:hypothetical protein D3C72_2370950 [compost metagenome]
MRGDGSKFLIRHWRAAALDDQPVGGGGQVGRRVRQRTVEVKEDACDAPAHADTRRNAIM